MLVELIHNPASGTYDEFQLDVLSQAFQACGARVRLGRTEKDGRFEIYPECDLVCVSGGDGALRLVVTSMAKAGLTKPLCIFPAGTVNLVAKELGYASDPEIFAREIMAGFLAKDQARLRAPLVTSDDHEIFERIQETLQTGDAEWEDWSRGLEENRSEGTNEIAMRNQHRAWAEYMGAS